MKKLITIISLLAGLILFNSCEEEIDFNGEVVEPKIVVNSFLTNDSVVKAHISKSRFFLSNKQTFDIINNAQVIVFVNNQQQEILAHDSAGLYIGSYIPKEGEEIRLEVNVPGYEKVEGTTHVQYKSNIIAVDTTLTLQFVDTIWASYQEEAAGYSRYYSCDVTIRIRDNENEKNFYRMVAKRKYVYSEFDITYEYFFSFKLEGFDVQGSSLPNLFGGNDFSRDEHLFTDDLFNGREFLLKFRTDFSTLEMLPGYEDYKPSYRNSTDELKINLQTIPQDTYLYLASRRSAGGILDGLFAEPVQIFNNIRNGIGIVAAQTNHEISLKFQ